MTTTNHRNGICVSAQPSAPMGPIGTPGFHSRHNAALEPS
jgi:hypothetical protein